MLAVFQKELNSFFNSLVGYLVISVFLTGVGLFVWVFPDNLPDSGFASLDILFGTVPLIYLFLVPAITMRSFAEEKRAGTMELLLTRPLTDLQIILGKYLASVVLVMAALVPTLVYYVSVWLLGSPQGNLDSAGVAGSYLGLVLLGASFAAVGVFASALTDSQITAFILAVFLCFIGYAGFSSLAGLPWLAQYAYTVAQWGMDTHFGSMGRGVVDSRDLLYFLGIIVVFIYLTWLALRARMW
jgi:ABC-2 type transport system permease protein